MSASIVFVILSLMLSFTNISRIFLSGLMLVNIVLAYHYQEGFWFATYLNVSNLILLLGVLAMRLTRRRSICLPTQDTLKPNFLIFLTPVLIFFVVIILAAEELSWSEIREFNDHHPVIWMFLMLSLFAASALAVTNERPCNGYLKKFSKLSPSIVVILLLKIKLFLVFVLYPFFSLKTKPLISLKQLFLFGILFFVLYFGLMTARWHGDRSINYDSVMETVSNVLDAGFERELYVQASGVFNHFSNTEEFLAPFAPLTRLILLPIDKGFDTSLSPNNPMYFYNEIVYGDYGSYSAHPSLYFDAFAQFGWFGVFAPLFVYLFLFFMERWVKSRGALSNIVMLGILFFCVLVVRGSSFYAMYYLSLSFLLYFCFRFLYVVFSNQKQS